MAAAFFFVFDTVHLTPLQPLISAKLPWSFQGDVRFLRLDSRHAGALPRAILRHPDLRLWVLFPPIKGTSEVRSPPFIATRFIGVPLAAPTGGTGHELSLVRLDTGKRLPLHRAVTSQWRLHCIEIPASWRGVPVRLSAVNRSASSGAWLGVGTPFVLPGIAGFQHRLLSVLLPGPVAVVLAIGVLIFLAIGSVAAPIVQRRLGLADPLALLVLFGVYASLGYVLFWCYFVDAWAGRALSSLLIGFGLISILHIRLRSRMRGWLASPDVWMPLVLTVSAAFFYLAAIYAYHPRPWDWRWTVTVYQRLGHAGDNLIPKILADRLFDGADMREPIFGQWQASDRPPLQTGIVLLQYPLWRALAGRALLPNLVDAYYQIFSTLLQCAWIAVAWAVLRIAALPRRTCAGVILALIPSGFFFFNSVFVWPKMLAGALGVGAFLLLLGPRMQRTGGVGGVIAASIFGALAFFSHGGAAFALLGLGIALLSPRFFPGWRKTAVGAGVFLLLSTPWLWYQRCYDPPANRLIKWHLADAVAPDARTAWQSIHDLYSEMSPAQWLQRKADFLCTIAGLMTRHGWPQDRKIDRLRRLQFWCLLPSLGLINAGWIFAAIVLFSPVSRRRSGVDITLSLLGVSLLSLLVWLLLLASEAAVIHAPYTPLILLFACLSRFLAQAKRRVAVPLFFLHVAASLWIWEAMKRTTGLVIWWENHVALPEFRFDPAMAAAAAATYCAMAIWLFASWWHLRGGARIRPQAQAEENPK